MFSSVSSPQATSESVASSSNQSGKVLTTPVIRRIARENNIDLATVAGLCAYFHIFICFLSVCVVGSGPNGRITRNDIQDVIDGKAAPPTASIPSAPVPVYVFGGNDSDWLVLGR